MTIERFRAIHRFLHTLEDTPLGPGVGLDITGSLWVFVAAQRNDMSLMEGLSRAAPQPYADELTSYAHAGWIDALHTYGNFSVAGESIFDRSHAETAIAELESRGIRFSVWVNHGSDTNTQNFGLHAAHEGDLPGSRAYHTDLLLDYGVRFAWNHRRSDMAGLESPLLPMSLRDGRQLWGFSRYTSTLGAAATEAFANHPDFFEAWPQLKRQQPDGTPSTMLWWPELLDSQLSAARLDELVAGGHFCVAAQHLGDFKERTAFSAGAVETFRRLRTYQDEGRVLVARVSRLLEYARVSQHLRFETRQTPAGVQIHLAAVEDPVFGRFVPTLDQLRGVTFYAPDPAATHLFLEGVPVPEPEIVRSATDGVAPSIGIRWFEADTTDHTPRRRPARWLPWRRTG